MSNHVVSSEPTPKETNIPPATDPYRILVVDDNDQTCELIKDILEESPDVQVIGRARDGKQAVELTRFMKPDVVLMDVNLPTLDGVQATYLITEAYPKIVVIGMTEHFTPSAYSAMRTAGAAAFACKNELLGLHKTILDTLRNSLTNVLMSKFTSE